MTLTPPGRGAVAVVRVCGCDAATLSRFGAFRPRGRRALIERAVGDIVAGVWGEGGAAEEVVVCRVAETIVEIQCHGGYAAVRRILRDLDSAGVRAVEVSGARGLPNEAVCTDVLPGVSNGGVGASALERECQSVLLRTTTLRTANIALEQAAGALRRAVQSLHDELAESVIPPHRAVDGTVGANDGNAAGTFERLAALVEAGRLGTRLVDGFTVAVLGRPNVGKSSLINALVGFERAIVFDRPGTTRDVLATEVALDGWPVRLLDTAGIRQTASPLEEAGIAMGRQAIATADLRLLVLDVSTPLSVDDHQLLAEFPDAMRVANKCDRQPWAWDPVALDDTLAIAARPDTAAGPLSPQPPRDLSPLVSCISQRLVPHPPPPGSPIPVTTRQLAALTAALHSLQQHDRPTALEHLEQLLHGSA